MGAQAGDEPRAAVTCSLLLVLRVRVTCFWFPMLLLVVLRLVYVLLLPDSISIQAALSSWNKCEFSTHSIPLLSISKHVLPFTASVTCVCYVLLISDAPLCGVVTSLRASCYLDISPPKEPSVAGTDG